MFRFAFTLIFALTAVFSACDDDSSKTNNSNNTTNNGDVCALAQCTENAHCEDIDGEPVCICDDEFTSEEGECINSKMVDCDDIAPENATSIITQVQITWTETGLWSLPETCEWECDTGFTEVDGGCSEDTVTVPLDGFGLITGECGILDIVDIQSATPLLVYNTIDFSDDPYDESDFDYLTVGGQTIATTENAGGSSIWSEVFAYEILARCELATLLKTETEIIYDIEGKITDILVEVDGLKVGVSVTRAMTWPRENEMDPVAAQDLLEGKLDGILQSTENVSSEDAWSKQILSVLTDRQEHISVLQQAWNSIDESIRANTIIVFTVTEGSDDFIYTNEL
ncbi:MAG: hypothetical protein JXR95_00155 [Deltaproteobacteria bacterium]|nr:hypothetical protein [Deltaproteobacteria bacterium]